VRNNESTIMKPAVLFKLTHSLAIWLLAIS